MCAAPDIQPASMTLRTAGRELDDISFKIGQLAHMIAAVDDRVDEHYGADCETNARASAMLAATALLLTTVQSRVDGLVDRMLHASEG